MCATAQSLLSSTAACPDPACNHVFREKKAKLVHAEPWTGSSADVPPLQSRKAVHNVLHRLEGLEKEVSLRADEEHTQRAAAEGSVAGMLCSPSSFAASICAGSALQV
jgi:hypothetical protein